jgi:hypothetical protein
LVNRDQYSDDRSCSGIVYLLFSLEWGVHDIGFVSAGQIAVIKLETFPFTRYGTVPATVKSVAADAVNDDKKGAIFRRS